jgi:hypothetical protein
MRSITFSSAAGAVLCLAAGVAQGHSAGPAPASTAGLDIVLTIEHTESSLPGGFPTMGAVLQTYAADGNYTYAGFGGPNHLTGTGTYVYVKTGANTATEDAVQYSSLFTLPYHMDYTFVTSNSGRWKQFFAGGLIVFEGSFSSSPSGASHDWAPAGLAGASLAMITPEEGHHLDINIVSYRDSTYRACGAGVSHTETGTYVAKRLSARSLVVESTGPQTLVVRSLTFTGPNGGVWRGARLSDGARSEGFFLLRR